jgi:hypothetical protein
MSDQPALSSQFVSARTEDGRYGFCRVVDEGGIFREDALVWLHASERELNGGRFARYSRDPQPYKVIVEPGETKPLLTTDIVNWVAENVDGLWSMDYVSRCYSKKILSFSDEAEALYFELKIYDIPRSPF